MAVSPEKDWNRHVDGDLTLYEKDGEWTISQHQTWIEGVYPSEEAARNAVDVKVESAWVQGRDVGIKTGVAIGLERAALYGERAASTGGFATRTRNLAGQLGLPCGKPVFDGDPTEPL